MEHYKIFLDIFCITTGIMLIFLLVYIVINLISIHLNKNHKEEEILRGMNDEKLSELSDIKLLCLSMAILYEAKGIEDKELIKELRKRGIK